MIEFWKQPENKQHDWINILEEKLLHVLQTSISK